MSSHANFSEIQPVLGTAEPPELGPGPRRGVEALDSLTRELDAVLRGAPGAAGSQDLIRAVVLLWHDHLDASHEIAQRVENADGSYVHGIMHRREPDYGNAKYWFRRVGRHPGFAALAGRAGALLEGAKDLRGRLLPNGAWDPFAMVDVCEELENRPGDDAQVRLVRSIQAAELEILLEQFCA